MCDSLEKTLRELIDPRHLQYAEVDGKQVLCLSKEGVRELVEMKVAEEGPHGNAARFRDWLETKVFPALGNSGKHHN